MLYLVFHLDADRYALPTRDIVEILPFIALKPLPLAPAYIAGMFDYRGRIVPVLDLTALTLQRTSRPLQSTRIVIVNYPTAAGDDRLLGLLAEQVVETIKLAETDFAEAGVAVPDAPYLGKVAQLDDGLIQAIEVRELLPDEVQALLFRDIA